MIPLTFMITSLIVVVAIDTAQKRRNYLKLNKPK
jgi:hypothetical protein